MPIAERNRAVAMAKRSRNCAKEQIASTAPLTEYELARARRIQQNKQVLVDMGLENATDLFMVGLQHDKKHRRSSKPKVPGNKEDTAPTRRSRRLASQTADAGEPEQQFEELTFGSRRRQVDGTVQQRRARSSRASNRLDLDLHHQHNMHRINSMSEKALIKRAWRITNITKLQSFIEVLEAADMETVLQEAKAALAQITGGHT